MLLIPIYNKAMKANKPLFNLPAEKLSKKITNRVITYFNDGASTVKKDGVRKMLVEEVLEDRFARSTGRRYVNVRCRDLDDKGQIKFRSLHVAGINQVDGRLKTALQMVKTLF